MSAKEVRARQRELARAEQSLLATEALAEKARLEEERRKMKEQEKRRKEREKEEKKEAERLAKEQRELEKKEERRLQAQEEMRRATEFIAARRAGAAEAQQRRSAAPPARAATHGQPQRADGPADVPTRRAPAVSLPSSATMEDGLTSSSHRVVRLLNAAAMATVAAFPRMDFFSAALWPLLWCPSSPPHVRLPDGAKLLAFASSCSSVLHAAWATGRAYPRSKADEACAAFTSMRAAVRIHAHACTHARTHAHMHTCTHAHSRMCSYPSLPPDCNVAKSNSLHID